MAKNIPVATKQLGNVAEIAGRLGIQGADNIQSFTRTVSKMGVATDISAEQAAQDFARLSNALGTPVPIAASILRRDAARHAVARLCPQVSRNRRRGQLMSRHA